MSKLATLQEAIRRLWDQIDTLRRTFPSRGFALDGRLVGDLGEVLAESLFEIKLDEKSRKRYDARTPDGRNVSIKAGFQNMLTFTEAPDLMIGIALQRNGSYEVVYNGPGKYISEHYSHRIGIGERLLRFPTEVIREINRRIPDSERVPERGSAG